MKQYLINYKYINKMFRERYGTFIYTEQPDVPSMQAILDHLKELMSTALDLDKSGTSAYAITDIWEDEV